jgi:hypothetical protein
LDRWAQVGEGNAIFVWEFKADARPSFDELIDRSVPSGSSMLSTHSMRHSPFRPAAQW